MIRRTFCSLEDFESNVESFQGRAGPGPGPGWRGSYLFDRQLFGVLCSNDFIQFHKLGIREVLGRLDRVRNPEVDVIQASQKTLAEAYKADEL